MKTIQMVRILLITLFSTTSSSALAETLTLWEQEQEELQTVVDGLIKQFQKANPGIEVKRSHYKTEDLRTQYQTAALGGGGADILMAPNDFAGPLSIMGIIKPVNDSIKKDMFYPDVLAGVQDDKGQIWGTPISKGNHLILFVNKKFVKKAPETIEELVKVAKEHSDPKKKQFGFAYNLNEPFWFVTFFSAYGELPLVNAKANLKNDGMIKALTLVHDLKFKDRVVPNDCNDTCADTLFMEGQAAMTISGDWAVRKYQDKLKENLIIAPLPKLAATGEYMKPMVSGKYLMFNNNLKGEKLAAAKKFTDFMISEQAQIYAAKQGGVLPSVMAVAKSDVITKNPTLYASLKAMDHGQPMPMAVEMRAVWDAMRPQLQGVMSGRTKPDVAAKIMQEDAETKIKSMQL